MAQRISLLVVVAGGTGTLALSFMPGWLVHQRVLLGEGPRTLLSYPTAWEGESLPVIAIGVGAILAAGLAAISALVARGRAPLAASRLKFSISRASVPVLLAVGLGVLGGAMWPISQSGHASSVALSPGWPLVVAFAVALCLLTITAIARGPTPAAAGIFFVLVLVAAAGGLVGRQAWLDFQESSTQHYAVGSYTRTAAGGQPTEILTLTPTTYRVGDRWSGSYEADGLVIVFTNDPACPRMRGSYHAHAAGGENIRLEAIVDLCSSGQRKKDLEAGTWVRDR